MIELMKATCLYYESIGRETKYLLTDYLTLKTIFILKQLL